MRILYGVVGEGMGHAIRSRVVIEHLLRRGHQVHVIASSRAADFLARHAHTVQRIHGLHIVADENRVRKGRTLLSNLVQGTLALPRQMGAYFELLQRYSPEAVISDFESWTYTYGKAHRLPIISIDNAQIINRCAHPDAILVGEKANYQIAKTVVKSKLPHCNAYLITTYFFPPVCKKRTWLYPPILRPEVLAADVQRGDHLLVYQTAEGHSALAEALQQQGIECRIYGMRRHIQEEQVEGCLRYRPFDETRFIDDLASAKAVIAGGGFTTLSECVYLHKPVLSVPIMGQFEQIMNARYLQHEGYGMCATEVDTAVLRRFLEGLAHFDARLATYSQQGNEALLTALDGHLDALITPASAPAGDAR
ncbi:MAG: glycosyltransferase family protein [Polyangiales bacterium]